VILALNSRPKIHAGGPISVKHKFGSTVKGEVLESLYQDSARRCVHVKREHYPCFTVKYTLNLNTALSYVSL